MIVHNLGSSHGESAAEVRGSRVVALYAFCDIRNFTDATEVL